VSPTKQDKTKQRKPPSSREVKQPSPQLPRTFFRRLSSIMPTLPHRESTPNKRPKSAPPVSISWPRKSSRGAPRRGAHQGHHPLLPPSLNIPTLSESAEVGCYNTNTYYSFPDIDEPAGSFLCGLISPDRGRSRSRESAARKLAEVRPCLACRRGSACSHIAITRSRSRHVSICRISGARSPIPKPTSHVTKILNEEVLGPRPYNTTPSGARVRFEDEPGRGRGRVRLPVLPPLNAILSAHSKSPSPCTPTAPILHHVHGLPRSREYPYVHKNDVAQHLAAQAAGAPSPIIPLRTTSRSRSRSRSTSTSPPPIDFSETIYYPREVSPVPRKPPPGVMPGSNPPTHIHRRQLESNDQVRSRLAPIQLDPLQRHNSNRPSLQPLQLKPDDLTSAHIAPSLPAIAELETMQAVGTVTVDDNGRPISVDLELETTRVYSRAHSPAPHVTDEDNDAEEESSFSTDTMPRTPSIVGGKRLELRGGSMDQIPRLRGGNGTLRTWSWNRVKSDSSILWRVKRRILTCRDLYDSSEDEALLAPRRVRKVLVRKRLMRDRIASPRDSAESEIRRESGASHEVVNAEICNGNAKENSYYFEGRRFGVLPLPPVSRPPTPWPSRPSSPSPLEPADVASSSRPLE
jgi:hypothetical protein